jgi:hypothetical protein
MPFIILLGWALHVAYIKNKGNAYKISIAKHGRKRPFEKT